MKQTKFVINILLIILCLVLYFCAAVDLYAKMTVTKFNFGMIFIATMIFIYRKEIIYLLVEREPKDKNNGK